MRRGADKGVRVMDRRTLVLGASAAVAAVGGALWFVGQGASVDTVRLTNHLGEEVRWGALKGRPRALFFGFTHCPVICPVTVYELNDALDKIGATNVAIDFVTVDPRRDTPERLREYFSGFGPRVRAFTGEPSEIARLAHAFGVIYSEQPGDGGDYSMDHTATVFLLDASGRSVDVVAYGSPPDVMQERLRALQGGSAQSPTQSSTGTPAPVAANQ